MGEIENEESPHEQASSDSEGNSIHVRDLVLVAVLSLIAIAPVYTLDMSLQTVFDMQLMDILHAVLPLLLLVPLPAAYVASISKKGFRKESLGALATAPLALINLQFAAVSAGLVLGSILVSYKAKSTFNGQNTNWVHFKAAGSMVTVLALTIGLATASFYGGTPEFREDIRGNLTQHSVDTALEYADVAGLPGGQETSMVEGQKEIIGEFAATLAENISTASIQSTETIVFTAVQKTQEQDSSKFDAEEQTVLRAAFDTAENDIPPQVSQQAQQQVDQRFSSTDPVEASAGSALRDMVTPRVRSFVDELVTDSREMAFVAFIAAFSIVMLFKLPFELLSAFYAGILSKIL